jgi:hypothetical protein
MTQKGAPESADDDASQAGHLEFGLIALLALAAMLFFIWLAIRVPALLERISSWRPMCLLVSCETQAQPRPEAQAQPEPESQPQPQPQAQPQPQPQPQAQRQPHTQLPAESRPHPPRHPPRPHMLDEVVMGECPPFRYWVHYSPRLREPQRRSPIECWRDRSIRGACFN